MLAEPFWTVHDAARFLAVSTKTVRAWQYTRRMPFLKIGGTVRFVPEELREWAINCAVVARCDGNDPTDDSARFGSVRDVRDGRHLSALADPTDASIRRRPKPARPRERLLRHHRATGTGGSAEGRAAELKRSEKTNPKA